METLRESNTQASQDAKQRLALSMVLSKFAPTLIAEPSVENPYGLDHRGNPRTRQQQEQAEGITNPFQGGMVGNESVSEGIGANLHRIQQQSQLARMFGGQGGITPRV